MLCTNQKPNVAMKPHKDPFETIAWSLHAQQKPQAVLTDIFNNDTVAYFKTTIQAAYRCVLQNKAVRKYQNKELFRVYLRVNSLILVGAYLYKIHKNRIPKLEKRIDNNAWLQDKSAQQKGFLQFYADPLYRIYCLFEMDTIPYWKADWAYFILAAFSKSTNNNTESYPSLNYFIHSLIDALYEMHQSSLKQKI